MQAAIYLVVCVRLDSIDHLTQGEAGHLEAAPSVDAIRTRIFEARNAGFKRLDADRTQAPTGASQQTALTNPSAGGRPRRPGVCPGC